MVLARPGATRGALTSRSPGSRFGFAPALSVTLWLPMAAAVLLVVVAGHVVSSTGTAAPEIGTVLQGEGDPGVAVAGFEHLPAFAQKKFACCPPAFRVVLDQKYRSHPSVVASLV